MRSSKSRSRSKQNRPRTLGNIINRVFDSSGPEGKVRGTPQQIIEKYQLLARDAQLSNDRVAAENFLQHAEHYTRLLAEATREMQAELDARQQYVQPGNGGTQNGQRERNGERDFRADREPRAEDAGEDQPYAAAFDVTSDEDAGLVELPEFARPPRRDFAQDRPREDRQRFDRPRDSAPRDSAPRDSAPRDSAPREDRPRDDRPRDDRPRDDRPRDDRPRGDGNRPRPPQERPQQDRPQQDRPVQERPREERKQDPRPPRFVDAPAAAPAAPEAAAPEPAAPKPRRKPAVKVEPPAQD